MFNDVYSLIAATSSALKKNLRSAGSKPKFPDSIIEIQKSLATAHDQADSIIVMKDFIRKYG